MFCFALIWSLKWIVSKNCCLINEMSWYTQALPHLWETKESYVKCSENFCFPVNCFLNYKVIHVICKRRTRKPWKIKKSTKEKVTHELSYHPTKAINILIWVSLKIHYMCFFPYKTGIPYGHNFLGAHWNLIKISIYAPLLSCTFISK